MPFLSYVSVFLALPPQKTGLLPAGYGTGRWSNYLTAPVGPKPHQDISTAVGRSMSMDRVGNNQVVGRNPTGSGRPDSAVRREDAPMQSTAREELRRKQSDPTPTPSGVGISGANGGGGGSGFAAGASRRGLATTSWSRGFETFDNSNRPLLALSDGSTCSSAVGTGGGAPTAILRAIALSDDAKSRTTPRSAAGRAARDTSEGSVGGISSNGSSRDSWGRDGGIGKPSAVQSHSRRASHPSRRRSRGAAGAAGSIPASEENGILSRAGGEQGGNGTADDGPALFPGLMGVDNASQRGSGSGGGGGDGNAYYHRRVKSGGTDGGDGYGGGQSGPDFPWGTE